jgi:tetratricopeptide (TPR) repeat protein
MKIQCLFLLILFVSFTTNFAQSSDSLPDIVARIKPSVVSIFTYDSSGKRLKSGSGFCVASNRIVTNKHVIEGAEKIIIRTSDDNNYKVTKIESVDPTGDLALLRTEELGSQIKPLTIADYAPRVGEKILVLGNPKGLEGTVSDGIVSAFRNVPGIGKLVQITAPISQGSSGSPVINMKGEVIGVATLNLEGGQNLNFAISSERIISLWSSVLAKTENEPVSNSATYKDKRWRLLTDKMVSYDTETFTEKLGLVTAWIQYKEADGSYSKVLTEINCKTAKIRSVQSLDYDKTGDVVRSSERASSWSGFVPETKGERMYKIFCKDELDWQSKSDWMRQYDLIEQAQKFKDSKDYEQAITVYNQIIQELPDYPSYTSNAYTQIGIVKKEQGKLKEAKTSILKAISLEPDAYSFGILGEIYEKEKNIPAAIDAFWKSLSLAEDGFFIVSYNLETIYKETKNYKGLADLYKFLIANGEIKKYVELADAYEKQGLSALVKTTRIAGINALEMSIRKGEADIYSYHALSQIYQSSNNQLKAEITLQAGIKKFSDADLLIYSLADLYRKNNQWEKAVIFLENTLQRITNDTWKMLSLRVLRDSYKKLGRLKDAEQVDIELEKLK